MQRSKETRENTLPSDWRSVLKKTLTGPTLLEMSGNHLTGVIGAMFRVAIGCYAQPSGFQSIQRIQHAGLTSMGSQVMACALKPYYGFKFTVFPIAADWRAASRISVTMTLVSSEDKPSGFTPFWTTAHRNVRESS